LAGPPPRSVILLGRLESAACSGHIILRSSKHRNESAQLYVLPALPQARPSTQHQSIPCSHLPPIHLSPPSIKSNVLLILFDLFLPLATCPLLTNWPGLQTEEELHRRQPDAQPADAKRSHALAGALWKVKTLLCIFRVLCKKLWQICDGKGRPCSSSRHCLWSRMTDPEAFPTGAQ